MGPPRILVVVLAGGAGGRLELLTRSRAKPAVPYGGTHRLIDFPLSNCLHSGLSDVWIIEQQNPVSLTHHLSNGRPWDLDRSTGGLLVLHPRRGDKGEGWHQGTADALWRQSGLIREFRPEQLVVLSADAVYRLDYHALVQEHRQSGAVATFVTATVDPGDAHRYGVVQVDAGRVTDYVYKPDEPRGNLVSNEVYVFQPEPLLDLLDELAAGAGDEGLQDLGSQLLPRLVSSGRVAEHPLPGYWRDVGTVDAYWESHRDLLGVDPAFDVDDESWPIQTLGGTTAAGRVLPTGEVHNSLVAGGSRVAGTVVNSVLSRGCVVEEGAVVRDSVLLPGARVRAGAAVDRSILDDNVSVGSEAHVGGDDKVTLIGLEAVVAAGARVPEGARFPEVDD
jgi:glucose-1-phosphate adenylyltransferase